MFGSTPSGKIKIVFSKSFGLLILTNSKIIFSGFSFSKYLATSILGEIILIKKFKLVLLIFS